MNIKNSDAKEDGILFMDKENEQKKLILKSYAKLDENAIYIELADFHRKVSNKNKNTTVDLISASFTLDLAIKIQKKMP